MHYVSDDVNLTEPYINSYRFEDGELPQAQAKALELAQIYPNTEWYVHKSVTTTRPVFRAIGRVTMESETIDPADQS